MSQKYNLHGENIIPFYIVEDRLKENFATISTFISTQIQDNAHIAQDIANIRTDSIQFKQLIDRRLLELEKKITADIGRELDGRIIVAINKNMASFAARMEEKQKEIAAATSSINLKMEEMKKKILFESTKEQQKAMTKEIQALQKKIKSHVAEVIRKNSTAPVHSFARPASREKALTKTSIHKEQAAGSSHQSHFTQEWVLRIKESEAKIAKIQDFIVSFDKRFYDNMTALKENWKELGEDVLETKKKLTSKHDELRLELSKVRVIREFQGAPEEVEESFKSKLMLKFTDIYQLLGQLVTRSDLESEVDRIKRTMGRHDGELSDLRQEMARNSDYFTFYINNSNTQDLSSQIKDLKEQVQIKVTNQAASTQQVRDQGQALAKQIAATAEQLGSIIAKAGQTDNILGRLREELLRSAERIDALEEHNNFTPQKMAKIHNTLDINFTPSEQELLSKKEGQFTQNAALKELRTEISKIKDQLFLASHELQELQKVKKTISGLEGKLQKIKVDSEEAVLARKPWFCLSCDKNDKDKQEQERLRKEASRKKLQEAKTSMFSKEKSDKLIKLVPAGEQKFQVYEKYREKYLSDSIRLPDIYKEKIGDKQPPLL